MGSPNSLGGCSSNCVQCMKVALTSIREKKQSDNIKAAIFSSSLMLRQSINMICETVSAC